MVFLQLLGCVVGFYFAYKFLELLITPFVMGIMGSVYILCGKREEYNIMFEKYKARKHKGKNNLEFGKLSPFVASSDHCVNPNSGMPMISGTSSDVGGNAFGTGKH